MEQFREMVPIAMDVGSDINAAIAIDWAARGAHVIAAGMASAAGIVVDIGSTQAIAPALPVISKSDADQGAPHRLRRF
ncbi:MULTISPECIES: hypothetical protein [unclassified Mesorhizobium]|uniref:hypothetical protein n=1 Tax=unclassified Mesorhizobium TaxID=325217 RepID=UPI001126D798|nr:MULTISPECIES: hypothetical protein [unclassified Mesorhizobium]MCA0008736.1 hypothetical protein [Mesorhizobium sp. B264B1B]MCA0019386.1 hypothetical protein [Mesorhizobium sp. B264B1A]MCA0024573.1 hypothetical protein [Mesorhizobium sp. B263B1A]MCA0055755.1 hypothetical protein [Mesorhizobium sp. B261B1A]TPI49194.1 hypothetical protein FJW11_25295 [Mesorhizobium sp. B3-1-1]